MTETAADRARQERAQQGLPRIVTNTATLARLAQQLRKTDRPIRKERAA